MQLTESQITKHDKVFGKIMEATVFLTGVQLKRAETLKLEAGINKITFGGISESIYTESVTAAVDHDCHILSFSPQMRSVSDASGAGRIVELLKKKKDLELQTRKIESRIYVCEQERELLEINRVVAGKNGLRADELKETMDYFKSKLTEIENEKIDLRPQLEELRDQIRKIEYEVGSSTVKKNEFEVDVEIFAPAAVTATATLSYFHKEAGWTPYYDIRADDIKNPVTLQFKSFVRQRTGEDWEDVKLVLSTGNPSLSGTLPELMPWYVDFEQPCPAPEPLRDLRKTAAYQSFNRPVESEIKMGDACLKQMKESDSYMEDIDGADEFYEVPQTISSNNLTGVDYELPALYTIPSSYDEKPVEIKSHRLSAEFKYYSIRKLEKDVFLVASVSDWTDLNLLEGNANIFFEGKYVGKSYIDPRRAGELIQLSLGRDPGVIVTRIKGKDMTEKSLMGGNNKITKEWTLTVKNTKGQTIEIEVFDQLPVSVNKAITIEAVNVSGAEHDKDTGKLVWNLTLDAGKSKSMTVKYVAAYPKNKIVVLD
ncbi:mucoidy inhibitor MuiA family protein [Methanolapillus ohkumae]|uniref:Mucoidy inhibitor MuiA family protein n=1 Tax=Methanolapillus ohkumae TaxID=3028298 RepID=A0AA96ZXA3_9EURY|nr:hypothetical protein MsAm2_06070 [Methanosarcinaceae archaeon Am2]